MMYLWTAFIFILFAQNITATSENPNIHLTIQNIPNDKGVIRVLLFKNADGFPGQPEKAFRSTSLEIRNRKAEAVFENLPVGKYAISVFHDSENTGQLRTNIFGAPKDAYGFSNNVVGTFSAPSFEKASFNVDKDAEIRIELR